MGWWVGPQDPHQGPEPFHPPVDLTVVDGVISCGGFDLRLVDEGDVGDLYTFSPSPAAPAREPSSYQTANAVLMATFDDDLRVELRAVRSPEASMHLRAKILNSRPDHRLRLHVALAGPAAGSAALAPFEVVERPLRSEGGTETPSPTWPAHGAVLAGDVAACLEGVFEYE